MIVCRSLDDVYGVDTNTKLTSESAHALAASAYLGHTLTFVVRYVFFGPARAGDIDSSELGAILGAGLTLILVQHPRLPANNVLGHDTGVSDSEWAVRNAKSAGYVPVPNQDPPALVLDMEGVVNPGIGAVAHAVAWCAYVRAQGYQPVVYVGYNCGLASKDLDALPGSPLFWCDFAPLTTRPTPRRGYCCKQAVQTSIAGVVVDPNHAYADRMGGLLTGLCQVSLVGEPAPIIEPPDEDPPPVAA